MAAVSNNLSKRISNTTQKITGSTLASNKSARNTISRKESNNISKRLRAANIVIPPNDFDSPESEYTDPFQNPVLLVFLLLITFGFIAYGLYYYYKGSDEYNLGQTFYGDDILSYEPLFTMDTDKIDSCVSRCKKDSLCQGVTFDKDKLICTGTEDGKLRDDGAQYTSWVKPKNDLAELRKIAIKENVKPIMGLSEGGYQTLNNNLFARPPFVSRFNYSFFLYINDFYEGQGVWRNILCKGTAWPTEGESINTPYWEELCQIVPDQCIGVWLAPFNNNLRISITTQHRDTGSSQVPQINQLVEYIDIYSIPTRLLFHLSINFIQGGMEVYLNGQLHKMIALKGTPVWNELPLTIFGPKSTPASIMDLVFIPESVDLDIIRAQTRKLKEYSKKIRD